VTHRAELHGSIKAKLSVALVTKGLSGLSLFMADSISISMASSYM